MFVIINKNKIANDEYWHIVFIVLMLIVVTILTVSKSFANLS